MELAKLYEATNIDPVYKAIAEGIFTASQSWSKTQHIEIVDNRIEISHEFQFDDGNDKTIDDDDEYADAEFDLITNQKWVKTIIIIGGEKIIIRYELDWEGNIHEDENQMLKVEIDAPNDLSNPNFFKLFSQHIQNTNPIPLFNQHALNDWLILTEHETRCRAAKFKLRWGLSSLVSPAIGHILYKMNYESGFQVAYVTTHEIAEQLEISERTAKDHIKIIKALGFFDVIEATPRKSPFKGPRKAPHLFMVNDHALWDTEKTQLSKDDRDKMYNTINCLKR